MNRRRPPRELAADPEAWPHGDLAEPGAAAIQHISRTLADVMSRRGLSLRGVAEKAGVNRQAIADLLNGRSWPDVATVARIGAALDTQLWPQPDSFEGEMGHEASIPVRKRIRSDQT